MRRAAQRRRHCRRLAAARATHDRVQSLAPASLAVEQAVVVAAQAAARERCSFAVGVDWRRRRLVAAAERDVRASATQRWLAVAHDVAVLARRPRRRARPAAPETTL